MFATNILTNASAIAQPADFLGTRAELIAASTGMLDVGGGKVDGPVPVGVTIHPYGSAANAFLLGLFSWEMIIPDTSVSGAYPIPQWHAALLGGFTCTPSTGPTGVANGTVPVASLYCSTIAITVGNSNVSVEAVSPTTSGAFANTAGHIVADVKAGSLLQVKLDRNGATNSLNCLVRAQ